MRALGGSLDLAKASGRLGRGYGGSVPSDEGGSITVRLRNPSREHAVAAPIAVSVLLAELGLRRGAHLVIVNGELVTNDRELQPGDEVEVRPVVSGGSA